MPRADADAVLQTQAMEPTDVPAMRVAAAAVLVVLQVVPDAARVDGSKALPNCRYIGMISSTTIS
jgi:hypothetical protein